MTSEKMSRKDKNQNIQVFVRLRPMNQRERDIRSIGVVDVVNNREVVVKQSQQTQHTKKFTFDRAFGPNAKQVEVYQDVVSPLIEEVLAGYNCTVFAYGQTGTGKTHTMVGEHTSDGTTWQNDPLSGIIPRALSQLFDELRLTNTEYTVRVSYLELYNEELFDLLSTSEDNSKLRIYEDVTRKGSNIVNGLEEITVYNKNEVYKIMSQGQERKRMASTLMNAQSRNHPNGNDVLSSRSHTVFTIVVHMKENSPEGEELVKIGKLNLVDLAGSENISKAGSDNPAKKERARECVNINQSLLTLGRVITALVERHPHIPYRESKLTRILQESLGGRTKTSIIATISPGHKDLEETMSTLEYAHRAKNIQNKPEINQKMTKKAILKEYAEEIDRLKRDLQATRDKNGVYLASETYTELTLKQDEQRKEIQELLLQKKAMEDARDKMEAVFHEVNETLQQKETQLDITKRRLGATQERLGNTKNLLDKTRFELDEQRHLVSVVSSTEKKLSHQATELVKTADVATTHVERLHETVERRRQLESKNLEVKRTFQSRSAESREQIQETINTFSEKAVGELMELINGLEHHCNTNISTHNEINENIETLSQNLTKLVEDLKFLSHTKLTQMTETTANKKSQLRTTLQTQHKSIEDTLYKVIQGVSEGVSQVLLVEKREKEGADCNIREWLKKLQEDIQTISAKSKKWLSSLEEIGVRRRRRAHGRTSAVQNRLTQSQQRIHAHIQEIQSHKSSLEQRLLKLETDIENKRNETANRIEHWIEREREIFEQRIKVYREEELEYLEDNLKQKQADINDLRSQITSILDQCVVEQQSLCRSNAEEIKMADVYLEERLEDENACEGLVKEYGGECDQDCEMASNHVEELLNNLLGLVHNFSEQITTTMEHTQTDIQRDVNTAISATSEISSKICADSETLVDDIVRNNSVIVHTVLEKVQNIATSTQESLATLGHTSQGVTSHTQEHLLHHGKGVQRVRGHVEGVVEAVKGGVEGMREIEDRYLGKEFDVYRPSGSTPVRQEYRFPRTLAATSPHERIIKRFRDNYQQNGDDYKTDECILLDDSTSCDSSSGDTSDTVSAASDDSVLFVTPSPLNSQQHLPLTKSTSESQIFQQEPHKELSSRGKENSESCIILPNKKPSKLPAPTSIKKPLLERNTPC